MENILVSRLKNIRARLDQRMLTNLGYVGVSNLLYAASQWGMLVVVAKLGAIEDVASFSLGLAVVSPVMIFLGANLKTYIATDVSQKHSFGEYLSTRLVTGLLALIIFLGIDLIGQFSSVTASVIFLLALIKIVEGLQEICWGISQRQEQMEAIGISRTLRSIFNILGLGLGMWLLSSLLWGMTIWLISWLCILIFYDLPQAASKEKLAIVFKMPVVRTILLTTLPLAMVAGIIAVNEKVPLYLIALLMGETAVGFFAPLSYVVQGVGIGILSLSETAVPRLAKQFISNRNGYVKTTLLVAGLGGIIGVFMLVVAGGLREWLIPILYTPEYLNYQTLFLILLGVGIIRYIMSGIGIAITAAGILRQQVPVFIINLVMTIAVCWILIPTYGLDGAAFGVGIGLFISLLQLSVLWWRSLKMSSKG